MPLNPSWATRVAGEINGLALAKAVLMLFPFALLGAFTANPVWIKVSLLAISTMIPEERLALNPMGVLLHGMAVIAGIYLLLFAQEIPAFFVAACMLLAAAVILITTQGKKLRALGNWTFIPVLILANELHESREAGAWHQALAYLPYLLIALAPTLGAATFKYWRARSAANRMHWFSRLGDFGTKAPYGEAVAAMVSGVGLAATLVEYGQMQHGQWVIWGAASVVTGTVDTARSKLRSRAIGVTAGVPLGIALGQWAIVHSGANVTAATLATFLTLVAFNRYVVAYFFRCTLVALAIVLANQSAEDALERLTHVLLGGAIGMVSVIVFHLLAERLRKTWPR
jgi:hypothetical protein